MKFERSVRVALPWLLAVAMVACGQLAWSQSATASKAADGMTMDQFVARQTARIMAADTDGDGRISRAEMLAMASGNGRDPARRFDAMDTDHDGYLDSREIRTALEQRFRRLDRNGDGILTADERMAARAGQRPAAAAGNAADMAASQP